MGQEGHVTPSPQKSQNIVCLSCFIETKYHTAAGGNEPLTLLLLIIVITSNEIRATKKHKTAKDYCLVPVFSHILSDNVANV